MLAVLATFAVARHPANIASARAKIGVDGSYELKVRFDVLAYCLDLTPQEVADAPMNALLDGPEAALEAQLDDAKKRFVAHMDVLGDGVRASEASYSFPGPQAILKLAAATPKQRLPVMATVIITGKLPAGSKASSFRFPESLGEVVLTTEFPYEEPVSEPVDPGSASMPLTLPTAKQVAAAEGLIEKRAASDQAASRPAKPVLKTGASAETRHHEWGGYKGDDQNRIETHLRSPDSAPDARSSEALSASTPQRLNAESHTPIPQHLDTFPHTPSTQIPTHPGLVASISPSIETPSSKFQIPNSQRPDWYVVLPRYIRMGYLHIVPEGLDHILFVLGLFLLSTRMKDLLKQITAFTVAHSLTLALSLYGVVRLPAGIVEPIIAASIVFVAVENLVSAKMHRWRVGVVFLFGLVHGLGFASALRDAGLAKADFLTALVGFNSGVELGQLSVVLAAFALVGWFRSHERYRSLVTVPASILIAATALFWTVERII